MNRWRALNRLALSAAPLVVWAGCLAPHGGGPQVNACTPKAPRWYTCVRASGPIMIDGHLDERAWRKAAPFSAFVDIEGPVRSRPLFDTEVRMLWDDAHLYLAARLEEPHVWATFADHDAVVWHENDFEVFIDPDGDGVNYFEIEINALNTVFDLLLEKPYREKGRARHDWTAVGLRSAVHVAGTLNDPRDVDRAWTVEMAVPWAALAQFSTVPVPPRPGDTWRMNFSRVQWDLEVVNGAYRKIDGHREHNWVWSPQGEIDMHIPARWGYVRFAD